VSAVALTATFEGDSKISTDQATTISVEMVLLAVRQDWAACSGCGGKSDH
jgi:hypothetical protein